MTPRTVQKMLLAGLMGLATLPALAANPVVRMTTSMGVVEIELYEDKAPATVKNFIGYAESGFYNGTVFHRVIPGFMIQGGGFQPGMREKPNGRPIRNEADNGLKNVVGSIAMARTDDPHSASSQFFINVANNTPLDHTQKTMNGWGYAVFGMVTKGMDVVYKISRVPTTYVGPFRDVPEKDVVISKVEVVKPAEAKDKARDAANTPAAKQP